MLFGIGFDYLIQWGHYRLTADMHLRLQGHLDDPWADAISKSELAECYRSLGEFTRAIELNEQALALDRETGNRWGEGVRLGNLGNCHLELGQLPQAIDLYEQALALARETGYRQGEAIHLGNLALCFGDLGQIPRAIDLNEQALALARETGHRQGEAIHLGNLGTCYHQLGQIPRAIDLNEQALALDRRTGHRYGEALDLVRLGILQRDLGRWEQAAEYCRQAIEVADAIGSAQAQNAAHRVLAGIHLLARDLPAARQAIGAAAEHDYPPARADLSILSGAILLRLDQQAAAARAFRDAITQADELLRQTSGSFGVMNTKALALCGLALTADPESAAEAAEVFRAARAITSADGIVRQVLMLFDVLAAADRSGILAGIRPALAGPDGADHGG